MNKNTTMLHEMSLEQITSLFEGLQNQISELKNNFQPKEPPEYLTRAEVAKLLSVDLSTLFNWVKAGKLSPFGISGRVYFKRSDIEAALIPLGKKKGATENE